MSSTRVLSRLSSLKSKFNSISQVTNLLKSTSKSQTCAPTNRISRISRLPVESSCLLTMLPLHTAIASARLQSVLSVDSHCWCLVPQGLSMPL